jgi:hypothetical protein
MSEAKEHNFLKSWHLKLGLLVAICTPAITATGAFYNLKADSQAQVAQINAKIAALELQSTKDFAEKTSLRDVQTKLDAVSTDVTEIKTLLKNKLR